MTAYQNLPPERQPVLVAGRRTPFLRSGGIGGDYALHELAAEPARALLKDLSVPGEELDLICLGNVVQELSTTNVAREAGLVAGVPARVPAYSVVMAGLSPTAGLLSVCDGIALGRYQVVLAGGVDNFSDLPIRMNRNVRRRAVQLATASSPGERLRILAGLRPMDLIPELPAATDLTTGLTMGSACEVMARAYGVTREAADELALRSHQNAHAAWEAGHYAADIVPLTDAKGRTTDRDDGVRPNTSLDKLAGLTPAFEGINTAGNSSGLTDGAMALLVSNAVEAQRRGWPVLARIVDFQLTGVEDLASQMLLGPAMAIPSLLQRNGLAVADIDVFELHEAFAAQILANQGALQDADFARRALGLEAPSGAIPTERLNAWGGSIALGNPFAATGGRLLMTASHRLVAEQGRYAVVASCAGGGLGAAVLLEVGQS